MIPIITAFEQSPDRGRIEIEYFSFEELDRIYNQIIGAGRN